MMQDPAASELTVLEAVAGAGKTTEAFRKAREFAKEGRNVLYTAYNTSVAKGGDQRAKELAHERGQHEGKIVARTMHAVALEAERKRLREFNSAALLGKTTQQPRQQWWPGHVANKILEHLQTKSRALSPGHL